MNSTKLNELSTGAPVKSSSVGKKNKANGQIYQVSVEFDDYRTFAPVLIPDLDEVRKFAWRLHLQRQPWEGAAFGWNAGYNPGSSTPPAGSKLTFTPADFWLGDGAIWFFAMLWEDGNDRPPTETIYDQNLVSVLDA